MTGKRWVTVVSMALVAMALTAGPARAQAPELRVSIDNTTMPAQLGTSRDRVVYVANLTDGPVRFKGIELVPGPGALHDFTLAGPSDCPAVDEQLPSLATCTFTVRFTPRSVTRYLAALQVHSNMPVPGVKAEQPLDSNTLSLTGWGFAVSLAPAHDFGPQPVGLLGGATSIPITTDGTSVEKLTVSGPDADDFLIASTGCDEDSDGPCDIRVRFAPSGLGTRTATLTVKLSSTDVYQVPLSGYGVPLPSGPKGDKGDPGQSGAPGAEGPRGPAGQVTCRNTAAARLLCDALLAPGTWRPARQATAARFTFSRRGRVYARGRATVNRHGRVRVRVRTHRRLHKGTYTLKMRVGHTVVLRRTVRIR